jgi:hypothetical protein
MAAKGAVEETTDDPQLNGKRLSSRAALLASRPLKFEDVTIEGVGTIRIRELKATERDAFEQMVTRTSAKGQQTVVTENLRVRLIQLAAIDENGAQLFTQADIPQLGQLSAAVIGQWFDVASRLSGLSAKDVEELEKNSESALAGASTSA